MMRLQDVWHSRGLEHEHLVREQSLHCLELLNRGRFRCCYYCMKHTEHVRDCCYRHRTIQQIQRRSQRSWNQSVRLYGSWTGLKTLKEREAEEHALTLASLNTCVFRCCQHYWDLLLRQIVAIVDASWQDRRHIHHTLIDDAGAVVD